MEQPHSESAALPKPVKAAVVTTRGRPSDVEIVCYPEVRCCRHALGCD